jgi:hypothetical protein
MFKEAIKTIKDGIGKSACRPVRALNAAVFEAVIVSLTTRLQIRQNPSEIGNRAFASA